MSKHYKQAREDHEYIWQIETFNGAEDMTGGYVDQEDLARLLKCPTKTTATRCYINQIQYFFQVGSADKRTEGFFDYSDKELDAIAARWGFEDDLEFLRSRNAA